MWCGSSEAQATWRRVRQYNHSSLVTTIKMYDLHNNRYQSDEFLLRSQAGIPAQEILAAATINCAELFMKQVGVCVCLSGRCVLE